VLWGVWLLLGSATASQFTCNVVPALVASMMVASLVLEKVGPSLVQYGTEPVRTVRTGRNNGYHTVQKDITDLIE
jgi:hypothetical protein